MASPGQPCRPPFTPRAGRHPRVWRSTIDQNAMDMPPRKNDPAAGRDAWLVYEDPWDIDRLPIPPREEAASEAFRLAVALVAETPVMFEAALVGGYPKARRDVPPPVVFHDIIRRGPSVVHHW